jgi:hypothetical protein
MAARSGVHWLIRMKTLTGCFTCAWPPLDGGAALSGVG